MDAELAILWLFVIYTPVLLLVSWFLEFTVDTPAKNFSFELDVQVRKVRPKMFKKDKPLEEDEEYYTCGRFSKRIWPIFAMLAWLAFVLIVTEVYIRLHNNREVEEPYAEYEESNLNSPRYWPKPEPKHAG